MTTANTSHASTTVTARAPTPLTQHPSPEVSVLVPAKDEAENLPLFMEQAAVAFAGDPGTTYEVVVVDDGSVDETGRVLRELEQRYAFLRVARHRSQRGIADALRTGYLHARGRILVFYPADLQFKPEDIPRLVAPILTDDADMVTGFKIGSYDKQFVSGIYNGLSRRLFDVQVKDLNSVKAYRREVMDNLPVRPDWHRSISLSRCIRDTRASRSSRPGAAYPSACSTCSRCGSSSASARSRSSCSACSAPHCSPWERSQVSWLSPCWQFRESACAGCGR
jgi:glycosyltransferase involved in cell wall biosynthesis